MMFCPSLPSQASPSLEVDVALPIEAEDLPDDLFSVFFKSQSHSCPWRSLLAHAIALQRPLLAVLAACHKVCALDGGVSVGP